MTDKKTPSIDEAIAADFKACIERDLSLMSPGQLMVTKQALSDFEAKNRDTSQKDMNRRIARMSDRELQEMIRDGDDARRAK